MREIPIKVQDLGKHTDSELPPAAAPEATPLPAPPSRSEREQLLDWFGDLPPSVYRLVLLCLANVALCLASAILLLQAERSTQVMELLAPLGGATILVSALWAFGLLLWGLWTEEVYTLLASLSIGTFAAVLPLLLVPWSRMDAEETAWARFGLALGVLALQAGVVALGVKPVWLDFCWRSLKRFGCNRDAAALRRACLWLWGCQKVDLLGYFLQVCVPRRRSHERARR